MRQSVEPPVLYVDTENGPTVEITLAEATGLVVLRDKDGTPEYAGGAPAER